MKSMLVEQVSADCDRDDAVFHGCVFSFTHDELTTAKIQSLVDATNREAARLGMW